jgi:hypothetical protein
MSTGSGFGATSGTIGAASTGAHLQVILEGAAQFPLTGRPSISYWRWRHAAHSNFAIDMVAQNFDRVQFGATAASCQLLRAGDLVFRCYCVIDLPALTCSKLSVSVSSGWANVMGTDTGSETGPYVPSYEAAAGVVNPIGGFFCHWVNSAGFRCLKAVRVQVGSLPIDTLWSDLLYAIEELHGHPGRRLCDQVMKHETREQLIAWSSVAQSLYVPLPFWFTTLSGSALALATLPGNNVIFSVDFETLSNMIIVSHTNITALKGGTSDVVASSDLAAMMLVEYVYLDDAERDVFRHHPVGSDGTRPDGAPNYDQLVHVTQRKEATSTAGSTEHVINLNQFANPIFELIWLGRLVSNETANDWDNYSRCGPSQGGASGYHETQHEKLPRFPINTQGTFSMAVLDEEVGDHQTVLDNQIDLIDSDGIYQIGSKVVLDADIIKNVSLEVNGSHRWPQQTISKYFRQVQPLQAHSCTPKSYIYCYAFSLSPQRHNPSGAMNATRLSTMTLTFQLNTTSAGVALGAVHFYVYARTYNVLQYRAGSAGLRFAPGG